MRKVKNKKVIRRLAAKSFAAAKTRNRIAVLAIALTAMLFTALFTVGIGVAENFQRETMRQSGGDSHGVFKNLTREQYEKLRRDPLIKESAACMMVSDFIRNDAFLKRHVEAWYYPKHHYKHCFVEITDGRAPKAADEILLDEVSLELLGLEPKAGQQVTLAMQIKASQEKITERTFTVSGVLKADPAMNTGFALVSEAYLEKYADELVYTYTKDYSNTGAIRMDVSFANSSGIQKKLNQVIENAGYSVDETSPDFIASNANWAYISDGAGADGMTVGAVAGGLILILLTGYLIIYNIFQISVIRDIRYYGLLKTIGTTGRQIRGILHRQALRLGLYGIPLGLLFGYGLGVLAVPRFLALSSYGSGSVSVSANPFIFAGAAAFTMLTVWISTGRPARIAAKVSPVEAVRYTKGAAGKKGQKRSSDGGRLYRMALSNLGRDKKRTVLVLLSLSLSVVLLNSVFTVTHAFDMDTYLKKFVSSDFLIANAKYFGQDNYWGIDRETVQEENLTESFVHACETLDGFEKGGRLYGASGMLGLEKACWTPPDNIPRDADGNPGARFGNQVYRFNEFDDSHYKTMFYGMEDFFYDKLEVYKGESDPQVIREKLKTGRYVVCKVDTDDNDFVIPETIKHQPGDRIVLTDNNGKNYTFEVLSLVKENYYGMTNRMSAEFGYYTDADVFCRMLSDDFLMSYAFDVADDKEAQAEDFIENYTNSVEPLMHYESKQVWLEEFSGMINLVYLVGGVLSAIVGLIGILNFVNSILTSMVTRQREFAMLEAIGMTRKQLSCMLVYEGVYYALFTIACSFALGCLCSVTLVRALAGGMWFMHYRFLITPMLAVFPVLLLLGVLVPKMAFVLEKRQSVVERLGRVE